MLTGKKKQRNVLLDPADDQMLVDFCSKTNRDLPDTMRRIVKLFFKDGMEAASNRLNAGLWELPTAAPDAPKGIPGDTPKARANYVLDGPEKTETSAQKPA
jgi:hypothetical protein